MVRRFRTSASGLLRREEAFTRSRLATTRDAIGETGSVFHKPAPSRRISCMRDAREVRELAG